jgi:hypothetical protein
VSRLSGVLALAIGAAFAPLPCEAQRSPADLALVEECGWILTANETSGSVTILDIPSGRVLAEVPLAPGSRPRAIAARRNADSRWTVAATERFIHRVALLELAAEPGEAGARTPRLVSLQEVATGRVPSGLLYSHAGTIVVACSGEDAVWEIDTASGSIVRRVPTVEGAHLLARRNTTGRGDADRILVAGRTEVSEIDLASGHVVWRHAPADGLALNLNGLLVDGDRAYLAHQVKPADGAVGPTIIIWGLTLANRITVLSLPRLEDRAVGREISGPLEWSIPLDFQDRASGDPGAPGLVPESGERKPALLVPSAGTQRILRVEGLDEPPHALARLSRLDRIPEVEAPARPLVARISADGGRAYVACWLDDVVLEVDVTAMSVVRKIPLGPAPPETPEHQGARIFYDADRSLDGWYSCHSCHPDV